MSTYIALLRGINVGGHNKIKMAELKRTLETMGLARVQTYIQSGNVLFESVEETELLRQLIEDAIKKDFGISITVVLRTAVELQRIIADCPFSFDSLAEGQSIHVSMLTEPPSDKHFQLLSDSNTESDEYQINGREIYFLFRQSILDSKLGKSLQKMGNSVTTRNWKTMIKLNVLAKAMES